MPSPSFAKYRTRLPQLDSSLFLTDGGLETTLIFHEGWNLPMFEILRADGQRERPPRPRRLL